MSVYAAVGMLVSCTLPSTAASGDVQYNRDIRPIFSKTCFACHGPDANAREAGLRLDVREDATAQRDGVRSIVPGDAAASLAFQKMTAADPDERMPPKEFHTQLSASEKDLVKRWINEGAKYEQHWAFIAPRRPEVPAGRNAIDHFVHIKAKAEELNPAKRADRATLIRRASLDLTGLPPTREEVRAFVDDSLNDSKAYAKVVDRLLESPRYAEHRTRYWLDASRYADTSGYQYDRIRHQWAWRDWVIHAFDSNMPFDQFTIEQTAGDLLTNSTPHTRLATGFHRNHPITIEGGVIDEEYRTEYVMDRVVTTSTTWLGLTLLCARCHDHKYDPISQDDFYSFYAFFNNVPERGINGFSPKVRIESPINPSGLEELEKEVAAADRKLKGEMKKLSESFATWEADLREESELDSLAVEFDKMSADGGTKLTRQDDGSVLAHGPNPGNQVYRLEFSIGDRTAHAIRLEALTDASHKNKSTGRGSNGNFVLSEVEVETAVGDAEFKVVKVASAKADYEQKKYPITDAIDGKKDRKGWAVDGNSKIANRSAVFTLAEKLEIGTRVRLVLTHVWGGSHTIGRFRVSVPMAGMAPIPGDILTTLKVAEKKRTAADKNKLNEFLAIRFGGDSYNQLHREVKSVKARRDKARNATPETMVLTELPKPRDTFVLMRGEYDKPIKERQVAADIPALLGGLPEGAPTNRLGFAKWLVSPKNPLTSRVTVNRFWSQMFGNGLVKTIEDFGSQGEYPSHPELLDWLAVEFVESGWDVKQLFRTIVTSETYCQDSRLTPAMLARDPDNRLLLRGSRYRIDAEMIRDSALAVSGLLDANIGGPSVYPYHPKGLWMEINNRPRYSREYPHTMDAKSLYRRSMYTFWKRTVPPPSMSAFDAPEREFCMVKRSRTNTPLQAFVMLHDPQFVEAARKLAERILAGDASGPLVRISRGFELCLSRPPDPEELKFLHEALRERQAFFAADIEAAKKLLSVGASTIAADVDAAELAAYTTVARIILNLSEFITKG